MQEFWTGAYLDKQAPGRSTNHSVAFFDRHLKIDAPASQTRRWWVSGAEVWRGSDAWQAAR